VYTYEHLVLNRRDMIMYSLVSNKHVRTITLVGERRQNKPMLSTYRNQVNTFLFSAQT